MKQVTQANPTPVHPFQVPAPVWDVAGARRDGWYFYQAEVERAHRGRVKIEGHGEMIMLGSYSYLGLIGHPEIQRASIEAVHRYGTGTHGVRLLAGTLPVHNELEREIADLKGSEDAVVLSSGFAANLSALGALVGPGDLVFSDTLNHASIVDGCRLSGARSVRLKHNDMDDLAEKLSQADPHRNKLVVADAVFSMDGDIYNLPAASKICRRYGALLMLDEAHSMGVIGKHGRGIEEHFGLGPEACDIKMGTFSKAIPSCGGYLAARSDIIDTIKHNGRGYIYSASLPPAQAGAALAALRVLVKEPWRVQALHHNVARFSSGLRRQGLDLRDSRTAIVPVICGSDETAFAVATECQARKVFVHAIPAPVVPRGTARLRCIVTADHTASDLDRCVGIITDVCRRYGVLDAHQEPDHD